MPPVNSELRAKVLDYAHRNGGLYSPVPLPEFADIPHVHGADRLEVIKPLVPADAKTALDIGAHWGYWSHNLEDMGLEVTAVESAAEAGYFIKEIRDAAGKKFTILSQSVLDLPNPKFDLVLGLNIFHHFIKKEGIYKSFVAFLNRLDCQTMIFQAHSTSEGQMKGAYRNFTGPEFCDFIVANSMLTDWEEAGAIGKRKVYKIWKRNT
ncbi:MAG: class I SAM-dependent methyltransferase [Brevundimonas sp.]